MEVRIGHGEKGAEEERSLKERKAGGIYASLLGREPVSGLIATPDSLE